MIEKIDDKVKQIKTLKEIEFDAMLETVNNMQELVDDPDDEEAYGYGIRFEED